MMDFGCSPIDASVVDSLNILSSEEEFSQISLDFFQKDWPDVNINPAAPYQLTERTEWKQLHKKENCSFQGRLIGGNMDTISKLIGTMFAPVKNYIDEYKEDGFIWFFESCDMTSPEIYRTLWQMKMNGWFEKCKGILYGRPEGYSDLGDFGFEDSLMYSLGDINIPVIYNADIGHMPPQLTFINGALAEVEFVKGRAKIIQRFIK